MKGYSFKRHLFATRVTLERNHTPYWQRLPCSSKSEELETSKSFLVNRMLLGSTASQIVHCGQKSSGQNPKVKAVVQSYCKVFS